VHGLRAAGAAPHAGAGVGAGAGAGAIAVAGARANEASLAARRASALERAAARFNACPRADRDALWRLAFAGQSLDQQAHDACRSLSEMARRARRALDALLSVAVDLGPPAAPRGEQRNDSGTGEQR
jgi:hypothetical protein